MPNYTSIPDLILLEGALAGLPNQLLSPAATATATADVPAALGQAALFIVGNAASATATARPFVSAVVAPDSPAQAVATAGVAVFGPGIGADFIPSPALATAAGVVPATTGGATFVPATAGVAIAVPGIPVVAQITAIFVPTAHAMASANAATIEGLGRRPITCTEADFNYDEAEQYIAADGTVYELKIKGQRWVMHEEFFGLPPVEFVTQRGPFQHGVTVIDYFLQPRVFQLVIRHAFKSRGSWQKGVANIADVLRWNRSPLGQPFTSGKLRFRTTLGYELDLDCHVQQGPRHRFPHVDNAWDEWAFQDIIMFVAHNPVYYQPVVVTQPLGHGGVVVPFGYAGNWQEYPTVVMQGPFSEAILTNQTTGEVLDLVYPVPAGRTVTFDLTYGYKQVTLDDGTNLVGFLQPTSNLASFHLEPGTNTMEFVVTGGDGVNTNCHLAYYNRFVARGIPTATPYSGAY